MRRDGSVSPLRPTDLKEVAERDERIRQLEKLNAALSAEVDRQRAVVDAVEGWVRGYHSDDELQQVFATCEARKLK